MVPRTAEQSEGNKTVGVDPTVITACKEKAGYYYMHYKSDPP